MVEYPVLTGAAMWVTGLLVPDGGDVTSRGIRYFDVNALVIALLAAVTVLGDRPNGRADARGTRPWSRWPPA